MGDEPIGISSGASSGPDRATALLDTALSDALAGADEAMPGWRSLRLGVAARLEEGAPDLLVPRRGAAEQVPHEQWNVFPSRVERRHLDAQREPRREVVLELAEACDVPVRWSCRTGVCHSCETAVLSGGLRYDPEPVEEPADGSTLICCSQPDEDLVLDL